MATTHRENYSMSPRYRTLSMVLLAVGLLSVLALFFTTGGHHGAAAAGEHGGAHAGGEKDRFWASLLQNSVYFLLITNASIFFITATTLAWGGWQMAFRRVPEAIAACVPVIGGITLLVLLIVVFNHDINIYHWAHETTVADDAILFAKKGFLNKTLFVTMSVIAIGGWSFLGWKLKQLSRSIDNEGLDLESAKKYMYKNTVWASVYGFLFALTVLSSIPWLWLMSIDAHWYSTMYSWYTFASSWVAGIALITLFVVYLKSRNYLPYVTEEHLHDLGKFMFAFSVFWTYLWYSQFMLIWYANIPEETTYFEPRMQGVWKGVFLFNLVINFVAPLLILMRRGSKRNYSTVTFMAIVIIFGHWIDFYQMVHPSISKNDIPFMVADFGVALGFVGLIMLVTGSALGKAPLVAKNHPLLKESLVHHT